MENTTITPKGDGWFDIVTDTPEHRELRGMYTAELVCWLADLAMGQDFQTLTIARKVA